MLKQDWDIRIKTIQEFFETRELPQTPVKLDACTVINDVRKFLEFNLSTIETNKYNELFLPYLERTEALMKILQDG